MTLMSIDNLTLGRGETPLLEGLNLSLNAGDICWIRGANGAGKTTLLRAIAGFSRPMDGSISEPKSERSIAYLGHKDGFDDRARLSSIAAIWSLDLLLVMSVTGVTTLATRRVFELSAGQRRKIDILRLLASERPIWLLDEPYASLDTKARTELTGLIRAHAENGGAALIVSHGQLPDFARPVRIIQLSDSA